MRYGEKIAALLGFTDGGSEIARDAAEHARERKERYGPKRRHGGAILIPRDGLKASDGTRYERQSFRDGRPRRRPLRRTQRRRT